LSPSATSDTVGSAIPSSPQTAQGKQPNDHGRTDQPDRQSRYRGASEGATPKRGRRSSSLAPGADAEESSGVTELQRWVVMAQRQALIDLRARDVIGDAAFQAVEEELDLMELTADRRIRP
jgi:hypothetical protein